MSAKINKNGKEYPIGVIPQNVIDEVEELYNPIKGSNANGTYVKYVDGTMICTKIVRLSSLAVNTSWGTCYESALTSLGIFAEEFIDVPIVTITNHGAVGAWFEYLLNTSKTYVGDVRMVAPVSVGAGTFNIHVIAIGKWK